MNKRSKRPRQLLRIKIFKSFCVISCNWNCFISHNYKREEILDLFYSYKIFNFDKKTQKWKTKFNPENYKAKNFSEEIIDAKNKKVIVKLGEKINLLALSIVSGIKITRFNARRKIWLGWEDCINPSPYRPMSWENISKK